MTRRIVPVMAMLGLVAGAAGRADAQLVTSLESSFDLVAIARVGSNTDEDADRRSQDSTLDPLNVGVMAESTSGEASVKATASGSATWADASRGRVTFDDIGWATLNVSSGSADLSGGTDWTYRFLANESSLLTIRYDVDATGDPFGLFGFTFALAQGDSPSFQYFGVTGHEDSGAVTASLAAGQIYSLRIENSSNIVSGLGTRSASMDGVFDFEISSMAPVPEPASVAMLGTGVLTVLGCAWRRRTRSAA